MSSFTNRLINEKSPYLLQQAHNPVDWYPWCKEAFTKAKGENKPIFLSIGYSACHWCHAMKHESFENEEIAYIMNSHFVNIKVDREENPGLDRFYTTFTQLTSGIGGWPVSIFLTPDLIPFFGATYFPPDDHNNKPGFKTLLNHIIQLWTSNPERVKLSGEKLFSQLKAYLNGKPSDTNVLLDPATISLETYHHFEKSFDHLYGGFGSAPKFPTPVQLQFLIDYYMYNHQTQNKAAGAQKALNMAIFTLKKITLGGIHDHIGGGFHRYSTDKMWQVPRFEKMLYDQAQLLSLYSSAYQITREKIFVDVIRNTVSFVTRDLYHRQGGFYSSISADSFPSQESNRELEGAFYMWDVDELEDILGSTNMHVFCIYYSCKKEGNAKNIQNESNHKNVLFQNKTIEETSKITGMTLEEIVDILNASKAKLWEYRDKFRPKPYRDEKIITSWNGLMITGLLDAFEVIQDESILKIAISTAEFIHRELYDPSTNTLFRYYCHGSSGIEAFAEDYCYLIQALLDLYRVTFNEDWVQWASMLQEKQNELFYDENQGGYFHVTNKDKTVLIRTKEEQDGAEPSVNSISVRNLVHLASLLQNRSFINLAKEVVQAFKPTLIQFPFAVPTLVTSSMLITYGLKEIVLVGNSIDPKMMEFKKIASRVFIPNKLVIFAKLDGFIASTNSMIKEIAAKNTGSQAPIAYICSNFTCSLPMYSAEQLKQIIS